jgi:hypothetical protein
MYELTKNGKDFIGYEYKSVMVKRENADLCADCYPSFGWSLEGASTPIGAVNSVNMKFKRDRKILNKAELTRLQRQFETQISEVESLESSKRLTATTVAYAVGMVGTALMAGSVFAYLADMLPLCIILAIPAFAGWVIPYFLFANIRKKKTEKITPLIDAKYDEIYETCARANSLIAA